MKRIGCNSCAKVSELASPQRIIWEGVLREVFLQIAAITKAFPTTASGDKKAMTIEVERATALKAELRFLATPSNEQRLLLMADSVFAFSWKRFLLG